MIPLRVAPPRGVEPSKNVTAPDGVPPAALVTVAVNVTACPVIDGFTDDEITVALDFTTSCVRTADVLAAKVESPA